MQPPCLARDCVVDAYLDPIKVDSEQFRSGDLALPTKYFLQTSPESAMKRMLAAGAPSIYSIGPVFRAGEVGQMHNIEFTMLEWYDVGATMTEGVALVGELALRTSGCDRYDVRSYRNVVRDSTGLDPIDCPLSELVELAAEMDAALAGSIADDRDALLDLILSRQIQPTLGQSDPVIMIDYPLSQAALAKVSPNDPQCAARFELFIDGVEIANGYDELRDVNELVRRYRLNNDQRTKSGRAPLEIQTTLISAMRDGLPQCTGVALGVDRLLMLTSGAESIDQVIPFPISIA